MLISRIESQKKDANRVNIYIDGIYAFGISIDVLAKYNIYESKGISESEISEILIEDIYVRFLNRALDVLLRSPKSEFQIKKYLKELKFKKKGKWYEESSNIDWDEIFEKVITQLKEYKYINDEEYAKAFVNSRISSKPRGRNILISELISKGINKDIAEGVCNELVDDEYTLLDRVFKKKYKDQKLDLGNNKMVGYLLRKGFGWDLINKYSKNES